MEKNGKIFVAPPKDGRDFKELFNHLAALGAGRSIGADGFPPGPWTPELLAEAITHVDPHRTGVDLRTVQLWFQENEKGISSQNIVWLARIFGCGDAEAMSEWQRELFDAQKLLTAKRRNSKKAPNPALLPIPSRPAAHRGLVQGNETVGNDGFDLAKRSEALFGRGSPLNLPASVIAGATALGFLSYVVGIHSVTYTRPDDVVKEVGFLWAPNWTLLFMVLLPLFFAFVIEVLVFWKNNARIWLLAQLNQATSDASWTHNVQAYSYTYWAVFVICVVFAGVVQWIGVCLVPLMQGADNYATSWGTIAIVRPDLISVPMEVFFTALAYLYMCLCFYLFFAGLILLHTIVHDLWRIEEGLKSRSGGENRDLGEISLRVMRGIFRCTVMGVMVAICMKVQSSYLSSPGKDIVRWIVSDLFSVVYEGRESANSFGYRMPTHYSSLLVAISACIVFLYGAIRMNVGARYREALWKMSAVVILLFATYLLIDAFAGFFDPSPGRNASRDLRSL